MSRVSRFFTMLVVVVMLLVPASAAFAAPGSWQIVDVTVHSEQQQSILLVSAELPADARLPYEAELAMPAGTQLSWIGEILGGDASADPELTYTKTTSGGMDVYRFTLTKARTAQVEGVLPGVTAFDGTNYATALTWTAWQDIPEVRISQRVPQAAQIVQAAEGAALQPGPNGYGYYTKTVSSPKAGDVLDLTFSYALPAAGAATGSGAAASGANNVAPIILAIVVLGGLAVLFVNVNKKMAARTTVVETAPAQSRKAVSKAAEAAEPDTEPEPGQKRRMNPAIPMFVVIGVLLAGFAFAGTRGTTAAVAGGEMTRDFGASSPCQTASLSFTTNPGVDLAKDGEQILKGFEGMEGVGTVSINLDESTIDMGWCESSQTEDSMRQVLSMTGLITLGGSTAAAPSAPTTATIDADGKLQKASVDTSNGTFSPSQIVLKAGVPAEIAFGAAAGCVTEVISAGLGINQDLSTGPATVKLPALEPGTYDFACEMGHQGGQFVVE